MAQQPYEIKQECEATQFDTKTASEAEGIIARILQRAQSESSPSALNKTLLSAGTGSNLLGYLGTKETYGSLSRVSTHSYAAIKNPSISNYILKESLKYIFPLIPDSDIKNTTFYAIEQFFKSELVQTQLKSKETDVIELIQEMIDFSKKLITPNPNSTYIVAGAKLPDLG